MNLFSLPKERRDVIRDVYFLPKVDVKGPNECWEWKAGKKSNGYGSVTIIIDGKAKTFATHRLAWELKYDTPVPDKLLCCHSCDNKACANALHIFIGTSKHNWWDAKYKGRPVASIGQRRAVKARERGLLLADFVVKELKNGKTITAIAKMKGKAQVTISNLLRRPYVIEKYGFINVRELKKQAGQMSIV